MLSDYLTKMFLGSNLGMNMKNVWKDPDPVIGSTQGNGGKIAALHCAGI